MVDNAINMVDNAINTLNVLIIKMCLIVKLLTWKIAFAKLLVI